jgi:hypothetical protein
MEDCRVKNGEDSQIGKSDRGLSDRKRTSRRSSSYGGQEGTKGGKMRRVLGY